MAANATPCSRTHRQIRELALEHAAGGLGDDTYLTRMKALREQGDAIVERTAPGLPGQRAVEWLRAISESIQIADVPKEKADLMHAIYERITVAGLEIVGVRLTASALRAWIGAGAARNGCNGAPDRCWTRDNSLPDADRGSG